MGFKLHAIKFFANFCKCQHFFPNLLFSAFFGYFFDHFWHLLAWTTQFLASFLAKIRQSMPNDAKNGQKCPKNTRFGKKGQNFLMLAKKTWNLKPHNLFQIREGKQLVFCWYITTPISQFMYPFRRFNQALSSYVIGLLTRMH